MTLSKAYTKFENYHNIDGKQRNYCLFEFYFIQIQSPRWTCIIKISILQQQFLFTETFGVTVCISSLIIHLERMVTPKRLDEKLLNWQCLYSSHKDLFKSWDAHNKHYTVIEVLSEFSFDTCLCFRGRHTLIWHWIALKISGLVVQCLLNILL